MAVQRMTIRGVSICYDTARPDGPVRHRVFLLSAPGATISSWRLIVQELLRAGCLCVMADMPGFGQSAFSEDMPIEQSLRARYMWGLLDEMDLQSEGQLQCWHLMGYGSACGTIAEMAIQQPDSASSLFMVSPILYSLLTPPVRALVSRRFFEGTIASWMRRHIAPEKAFARLAERLYARPLSAERLKELRRPLLRLIGHEEIVRHMLLSGYKVDTGELSKLFMPAMIIWGGRDALLGGSIPHRLSERDFPSAEYHLLPTAGHYAMETNSRAVCDFLRGWIREMWSA